MKKLKIGGRILVGFGSITLLILIMLAIATVGNLGTLSDVGTVTEYNELQTAANNAMDIYNETRMSARQFYNEPSETAQNDYTKQILYAHNRLDALQRTIAGNSDFAEFEPQMAEYSKYFEDWVKSVTALQKAYADKLPAAELTALSKQTRNLDMLAREAVANIALFVEKKAARRLEDALENAQNSLIIMIAITAIAIVAVIMLTYVIVPSITRPLTRVEAVLTRIARDGEFRISQDDKTALKQYAAGVDEASACAAAALMLQETLGSSSKTLESVANGDLTPNVRSLSERDEMGNALSQMLLKLNDKFSTILTSARDVGSQAASIGSEFGRLQDGSREQSEEVERLNSAITEMSVHTQGNAQVAVEAKVLTDKIRSNAETASGQMNDMISAMGDINAASQSISNIISIIENIAFQTNILALNAAVEAARAGQHGTGFAVVAEEVRSLAAKSADAAKNSTALIENSIAKAKTGVDIANKAFNSLEAIVVDIKENDKLMSDITKSSAAQEETVEQMKAGVERVSFAVQQSNIATEQSVSSLESISREAIELSELVSDFRLKPGFAVDDKQRFELRS